MIISWQNSAVWIDWIVNSWPPLRAPPTASTPATLLLNLKSSLRKVISRSRKALQSDDMLPK